jgi:hypothetical protein
VDVAGPARRRDASRAGADRLLDELEAEARYRRERLALYRAKAYGSQNTSGTRMRKLQQASDHADERLRALRRELHGSGASTPDQSTEGPR